MWVLGGWGEVLERKGKGYGWLDRDGGGVKVLCTSSGITDLLHQNVL